MYWTNIFNAFFPAAEVKKEAGGGGLGEFLFFWTMIASLWLGIWTEKMKRGQIP